MKSAKWWGLYTCILALVVWPLSALAGRTSGTVSGALIAQTAGACNVGYSALCPSGNCICDIFTGTIKGKPIGKGNAKLWATIDQGAALSSGSTCEPVFAVLEIATAADQEVINAAGSACNAGAGYSLAGGFGIAASAVGAKAWGSLTGSFNLSSGAGLVKYKGTAF